MLWQLKNNFFFNFQEHSENSQTEMCQNRLHYCLCHTYLPDVPECKEVKRNVSFNNWWDDGYQRVGVSIVSLFYVWNVLMPIFQEKINLLKMHSDVFVLCCILLYFISRYKTIFSLQMKIMFHFNSTNLQLYKVTEFL